MALSVVTPFKGEDPQNLAQLYDLILQVTQSDIVNEIIVVSAEKDLKLRLHNNSKLTVINIPNVDVGEARNIGVKHAKNNYVLFLDADCKLPNDFF